MRFPVVDSVTRACSFRVEINQFPSPESATLPPVWMGSYVLADLKLRDGELKRVSTSWDEERGEK